MNQFLGAINFYHRFITGFSILADPLFDLIEGRTPFRKEPAQQSVFICLLKVLLSSPLLHFLDWSKELYFKTNSSQVGIRAALT